MDMRVQKNRERLIDGFVKAIIVYDDYFKVHLTYTDDPIDMPTTEEIEFMDQSSDIASAVSPKKTHTFRCVSFFAYGNRKTFPTTENCCLRYQSLPLGEGGFFDLPLMRANRKRRMRAFLALNLLTFLYNRLEEVPHQSPQSVPKSRLWRQLPPGEAFGRCRASARKQQFIF